MNIHKKARLTPHGRALLVIRVLEEGRQPEEVAQARGISVRTVYKWVRRYREEGETGLQNRSLRPRRCPHAVSREVREQLIERRRQRQTYRQVSQRLGIGHGTVARLLVREGLNRRAALAPARPDNRYEHDAPGDLLHLDIEKLGRFERPGHRVTGDRQQNTPGVGWEYVHVAIEDHSRLAFSSLPPDETGWSAGMALLRIMD